MNGFDPRELDDRALFSYLLFGDLARPGWSGRNRQLALRLATVALMTAGALVGLVIVCALVVLVWAAGLPR